MIVCGKCGKNNLDDDKYCIYCKNELKNISLDYDNTRSTLQIFNKKQNKMVERFIKSRERKIERETKYESFKSIFSILWIIFGGIFTSIYVGLCGVVQFLTIVGIPCGIVLFKSLPVVFNPVGKRIVSHYKKHPILNTLWLVMGGFIFVVIYYLYLVLLNMTIVGIPLSRQIKKIVILLIAPFGAEIITADKFSSDYVERYAYTIQYYRKNRIKPIDTNLYIDKITNVKKSVISLTYSIEYIIWEIIFISLLFSILLPYYLALLGIDSIGAIELFLFLSSFSPFNFAILVWYAVVINGITSRWIHDKAVFLHKYDYGYSTRSELISLFDGDYKIKKRYYSLLERLYREYQNLIDDEINKDAFGN